MPGVAASGGPVCVDCAGISTSFICASCGSEDELWFARTCLRCSLRRRATTVVSDGSGQVPAELRPVFEAIATMTDPWAGLIWLQSQAVRDRLAALATGAVPISHEGIDRLDPGRGREYLRELLMTHRVLPLRDKYLLAFERWATGRLVGADDPDRRLIQLYLRWRHLRELTARAETGPLTQGATATARSRTNAGIRLLDWLRGRGQALRTCTQADIDAWYSTASHPHGGDDFLNWAIRHRHCPRLQLPPRQKSSPGKGNEADRVQLLARLLDDDTVALDLRVAGCLNLLLAQPTTRIVELTLDQIDIHDDQTWIRLSRDPVPLPAPIARLITQLASARRNMTSAGHRDSPWLFPGQAPGQHLQSKQLSARLARIGVRNSATRQAALTALAAEVPAPVLAEALGFHPRTLIQRAGELGIDWAGYAATKTRSTAS
ncbi:MAG: hypothetical protein ACRDK0_12235 [Solirubrobacteraceae bacterium]